jgi:hypothetical protein
VPTVEQLKLNKEKVEHYCLSIASDKEAGIRHLKATATKAMQGDVYALALARDIISIDDVPPKLSSDVAERYLKEAAWRERDVAADRGTEVHDLAERLTQGEKLDVPPELSNHILSWRQFVDEWEMEFIETEFTVFHPEFNYAGTGDFLARSGIRPEWGVILGDYKTSKSGIWPDIALQLAALKYAKFIGRCNACADFGPACLHPADRCYEDFETLKSVQTCVGVQITEEGFQVVPVRVTDATFQIFLSAINVHKWKTEAENWALDLKSHPFTPRKEK